jgi:hypothetical protein
MFSVFRVYQGCQQLFGCTCRSAEWVGLRWDLPSTQLMGWRSLLCAGDGDGRFAHPDMRGCVSAKCQVGFESSFACHPLRCLSSRMSDQIHGLAQSAGTRPLSTR